MALQRENDQYFIQWSRRGQSHRPGYDFSSSSLNGNELVTLILVNIREKDVALIMKM